MEVLERKYGRRELERGKRARGRERGRVSIYFKLDIQMKADTKL